MEKAIPLIFLSLVLSPIIYFLLGRRTLGWMNLSIVLLYLVNWVYVISAYKLNPVFSIWKVTWGSLLFISVCFLLIGVTWVFLKIAFSINRFLLPLIILVDLSIISPIVYYNINYGWTNWSMNTITDFLLFYLLPIYLLSLLGIGIIVFCLSFLLRKKYIN
jgi:hypothetical protein